MHHRKNEDHILMLRVDDPIGKTAKPAASHVIFKNGPSRWETENAPNGRMNFDREIGTETRFTILLIVYGGKEFRLSFRMKRIFHLASRSRALANTSSPGIGFTVPERSSSSRFLATSAH
jgi:hypothetical protein